MGESTDLSRKVGGDKTTAEAIDLVLPSGTKWASCNVGASKPEDFGGYYAWGEIQEQDGRTRRWANYHSDFFSEPEDIGNEISGTEYDVAHMKWGGDWRMPTWRQCRELIEYCVCERAILNGVNGWKFTSKVNGNSIFLPSTGYCDYGCVNKPGEYCRYWTSSRMVNDDLKIATSMGYGYAYGTIRVRWYTFRYRGYSVRPVTT